MQRVGSVLACREGRELFFALRAQLQVREAVARYQDVGRSGDHPTTETIGRPLRNGGDQSHNGGAKLDIQDHASSKCRNVALCTRVAGDVNLAVGCFERQQHRVTNWAADSVHFVSQLFQFVNR